MLLPLPSRFWGDNATSAPAPGDTNVAPRHTTRPVTRTMSGRDARRPLAGSLFRGSSLWVVDLRVVSTRAPSAWGRRHARRRRRGVLAVPTAGTRRRCPLLIFTAVTQFDYPSVQHRADGGPRHGPLDDPC